MVVFQLKYPNKLRCFYEGAVAAAATQVVKNSSKPAAKTGNKKTGAVFRAGHITLRLRAIAPRGLRILA